tara:strand:- start:3592 stop:4485 length:894 start_codon:yes stop_codon:yes gene_type:complete
MRAESSNITSKLNPRLVLRKRIGAVAYTGFVLSIAVGLAGLLVLLIQVLLQGLPWVSWHFLTDYPSRFPEIAGMRSAIFGSIWIMGLTFIFTVPVGVGAAIYLEEYAPKNWFTRIIEINISNLAGVPSIVYGLLGLALFVEILQMGRIIVAGALTMSLLVMPIVIIASREAIKAVPQTYREASYGLGATKFQTVKEIVVPHAIPGIMTGTILAMSRAIGEAAPMVAISALVYITFTPNSPLDQFTVMPIQIFNWVADPRPGFRGLAAAGIIILLVILLTMNAVAIYVRNKTQKRSEE